MKRICELDTFTQSYIECLFWVHHENNISLSESEYEQIEKDCESFQKKAEKYLKGLDEEQSGHDFYLTRNGHGSGFWDRGYDKTIADELCRISKEFGESNEGTQLGAKQ